MTPLQIQNLIFLVSIILKRKKKITYVSKIKEHLSIFHWYLKINDSANINWVCLTWEIWTTWKSHDLKNTRTLCISAKIFNASLWFLLWQLLSAIFNLRWIFEAKNKSSSSSSIASSSFFTREVDSRLDMWSRNTILRNWNKHNMNYYHFHKPVIYVVQETFKKKYQIILLL